MVATGSPGRPAPSQEQALPGPGVGLDVGWGIPALGEWGHRGATHTCPFTGMKLLSPEAGKPLASKDG